jgi:hypothetical protein
MLAAPRRLRGDGLDIPPQVLLLLPGDRLGVGLVAGKGEVNRRPHAARGAAWSSGSSSCALSISTSIPMPLAPIPSIWASACASTVAVEPGDLPGLSVGIVGIDDKDDALVGIRARRETGGADIVERVFRIAQDRQLPAAHGGEQRQNEQQDGDSQSLPAKLAQPLRQAMPQRLHPIWLWNQASPTPASCS